MRLSAIRSVLVLATAAAIFLVAWGLGGTTLYAQQVYTVSEGVLMDVDEDGAYLGVRLVEETEHPEGGALVTHVVDDSPAAAAGLKEDDIIVEFDGEVVRGPNALTKRIHAREPGDRVSLKVVRDGRKTALDVELGARKGISAFVPEVAWDSDQWNEWQEQMREQLEKIEGSSYSFTVPEIRGSVAPFLSWGRPKLGVELVETTVELREHLGGSEKQGVLVSKVLSGTPAAAAGIDVGDLILSVDGRSVATVGELRAALADKTGRTFPIEVVRKDRTVTVEVTIPEPEEDRPTGPRASLTPAPAAPPAPQAAPVAPAPPAPPAPAAPPAAPAPPGPAPVSPVVRTTSV